MRTWSNAKGISSFLPLNLLLFVVVGSHGQEYGSKKCPGYCTDDFPACRAKGGKIYSYCSSNLGCCEVAGSCGQSMSAKILFFKSPSYPELVGGDLTCEFKAEILQDTVGLRVDFVDVEMDGQSYLSSPSEDGQCDSDMIYLKGFNWWTPPPRCGNMTGYSTTIDVQAETKIGPMKTLTVVALMSSPSYKWHIKITQISRNQLQLRREELREFEIETAALPPIGSEDDNSGSGKNTATGTSGGTNTAAATGNTNTAGGSSTNTGATEPDDSSQETTTETSDEDDDDDSRRRSEREARRVKIVKNRSKTQGRAGANETTGNPLALDVRPGSEGAAKETPPPSNNKQSDAQSQFPWKASFRISKRPVAGDRLNDGSVGICKSQEGTHFCSGSFVGAGYLLSAAHCFFGSSKTEGMVDLNDVRILLGDDSNLCNGTARAAPNKVYRVDRVTYHYGYDQNLILNDLVLVKLKSPPTSNARRSIDIQTRLPTIRLAQSDENYIGKSAVANFIPKKNRDSVSSKATPSDEETEEDSQQQANSKTNSKQSLEFKIQNQTFCNGLISEYYSAPRDQILGHPKYRNAFDSTLCVITKDANKSAELDAPSSGMGDSGGPLVLVDESGKPVLVGVVSYGVSPDGDNSNYFRIVDYFTSVAHYRTWIDISMVDI